MMQQLNHQSPLIQNPSNIVIGWIQFDVDSISDDPLCPPRAGYAYSHDGGRIWTAGVLNAPQDPCVEGYQPRADPVVGVSPDGLQFYYASLRQSAQEELEVPDPCHEVSQYATDVYISEDAGETWALPSANISVLCGDKPWMTVDPDSGYIYLNSTGPDAGYFTRSTDSGESWMAETQHGFGVFGTIAVAPNSYVYAAAAGGPNGFTVSKSTNGTSWSQVPVHSPSYEGVSLGGSQAGGGPNPHFGLLGQAWIAVNPDSGNLYLLCSVDPPPAGGSSSDPLDVYFSRSEDNGQNWSEPMRVNDDPPYSSGDSATHDRFQWFGTMSVSPDGSRIDAIWNDTRNGSDIYHSRVYYSYSLDDGDTWSENVAITPEWDSSVSWGGSDHKICDYYHMISDNDGIHLAYAATFNGEQDIYYLHGTADCNDNDEPDILDIENEYSEDCNENLVPDECEPGCGLNLYGMPDECVLALDLADDCNENGIPDGCEGPDCQGNHILDVCEIEQELCDDVDPQDGWCDECDGGPIDPTPPPGGGE
jgi:hypothetical protein